MQGIGSVSKSSKTPLLRGFTGDPGKTVNFYSLVCANFCHEAVLREISFVRIPLLCFGRLVGKVVVVACMRGRGTGAKIHSTNLGIRQAGGGARLLGKVKDFLWREDKDSLKGISQIIFGLTWPTQAFLADISNWPL